MHQVTTILSFKQTTLMNIQLDKYTKIMNYSKLESEEYKKFTMNDLVSLFLKICGWPDTYS